MMFSARIAVWICAVFGLVCAGAALTALTGAPGLADAAEREASYGYGAFWGFLALIAVVFGVLSWLMAKGKLGTPQ
ncbi:MAG TPA: hypothetical protein VNU64_17030 [Burkholderiales bacterium]|nr:hypothetical protein [Burkholderiales bacterium]